MSQALYRKWRPQTWDEVIGQDHIITTLHNSIAAERTAHAFLFAGPRGTGKTSTARLIAKAVNCLAEKLEKRPCNQCEHCKAVASGRFIDLIEIDAASNTSVDDVRSLREKINFSPNRGRYKVYIIDEVHMLSTAAFNALLKTLEEPPAHAIFVLATTEAHKIPATVTSRCQRHEFRRIPVSEIVQELERVAAEESIAFEKEAFTLVARQATGSMRDAISLLDQLASSGETITLALAQSVLGTAADQSVLDLVEAVIQQDSAEGLAVIHRALDTGGDPRQFARQVVEYLRELVLVRMGNADQVDVTQDLRTRMASQANHFSRKGLLKVIKEFNQAADEIRFAWQPSLPLELAFIGCLDSPEESGTDPPGKPVIVQKSTPNVKEETALKESSPADEPPIKVEKSPLANQVREKWDEVITQVRRRNPQTQALLRSCKPMGIRKGKLLLGFQTDVIRVKMEEGSHVAETRKVIAEVLGEEIEVECLTLSKQRGELPPDIDQDGLVATAVRDLGGEIVNYKKK